jgi:hypothetical protein
VAGILLRRHTVFIVAVIAVAVSPLTSRSIVGLAVGGAGYYLWKLSQGPEVVWDRHGDWRPWDRVSWRRVLLRALWEYIRNVADSLGRSSRTRT